MNQTDAMELWATLGAEGKAPTEITYASQVLPNYTVGFGPWIDRIAKRYLHGLCRRSAHFKLALAPYGGGKTHFLVALGLQALQENFAVAYVPCGDGVSPDSPLSIYHELVRNLRLPGNNNTGIHPFLATTVQAKREQITRHGAPDVDEAFQMSVTAISRTSYPENAFGRVIAAALRSIDDGGSDDSGDAAIRWLQGDINTLTREEMQDLRVARVYARDRNRFGWELMLSLVKFLSHAGVHGLVLLLDEVESLLQGRRIAAEQRILAAMRVLLDRPDGVSGGVPLLGVFSATENVLEGIRQYPALDQRLAVRGATFGEGNDFAPQLALDRVLDQLQMLTEIGERLLEVGRVATGYVFNQDLQLRNARGLAQVAFERDLDVDARRLFVKTWVGLLDVQATQGDEKEFSRDELEVRYAGTFDSLEQADSEGYEP